MTGQSNVRGVQSLKLGAAAQTLPLVAGYGVNLLATPYVVSRLGLHDFGIWSITGAIAQYAGLFDLGAYRATNRYVALFHARGDVENERSVIGVSVTALIGLGCVLYAIPLLIPGFLDQVLHTGDPALAQFLVVCAVTVLICWMLGRALAAASFGRGRQVAANVGIAVFGVAQGVGGAVEIRFISQLPVPRHENAGGFLELATRDGLLHARQRRAIQTSRSRVCDQPAVGPGFRSEIVVRFWLLRGRG